MERHLDKWVLITGANDGGRGDALTTAFLARGYNVIAASVHQEKLTFSKPAEGSNDGFLVRLGLDGTSAHLIAQAVKDVEKLTDGKLDVLINNAACGYYMPLMDARIKDARHQFDVNVWGSLAITQAFCPMLRAAKGTIVNHITNAGLSGLNDPFMGIYASSQAAIRSMSDTLRLELAPFDVKVITFITSPATAQPPRATTEDLRFGLPAGSTYRFMEDGAVQSVLSIISAEAGHPWAAVAESMVKDFHAGGLQHPPPAYILNGLFTRLLYYLGWLIPAWVADWLGLQKNGLSRLQKQNQPTDTASTGNVPEKGLVSELDSIW